MLRCKSTGDEGINNGDRQRQSAPGPRQACTRRLASPMEIIGFLILMHRLKAKKVSFWPASSSKHAAPARALVTCEVTERTRWWHDPSLLNSRRSKCYHTPAKYLFQVILLFFNIIWFCVVYHGCFAYCARFWGESVRLTPNELPVGWKIELLIASRSCNTAVDTQLPGQHCSSETLPSPAWIFVILAQWNIQPCTKRNLPSESTARATRP